MKLESSKVLSAAFLVIGSMMPSTHAQGTDPFDAGSLNQAVGVVYESAQTISEMMKVCQEMHPEQAAIYQMAGYMWHGNNFEVVRVAQELMANKLKNNTQRQVVHAMEHAGTQWADLNIKAGPSACPRLANAIFAGSRNVKVATPKAYMYLMTASLKNTPLVGKKRRNDLEVGCVIRYWNKGNRDFDKGLAFCRCTTDLVYSALTQSERQAMFAQAGGAPVAADSEWMQKLQSKAQPCRAILQSSGRSAKSAVAPRG
ncbi:MAG: hypothetical protein ABI268_09410 [Rhodanobacter sp.]